MTFPAVPLSNQWTDNEDLVAADMYARIDAKLNLLQAAVGQLSGVLLDSGTASITPSGVNAATTLAVSFSKTFPSTPRVFCQFATGLTGTVTCFVWPTSTSTSGYTLNINRGSTTTTTVLWVAVSS